MRMNPNERGFDIVIMIVTRSNTYFVRKCMDKPPYSFGGGYGDDLIPYALKHKPII
jgi:hypothetical protein